ncbi:hypothetical protein OIU76_028241 [Salix suchowensis]|nr:hypothetical protein OIU76_028241 [Salix suchowensis]
MGRSPCCDKVGLKKGPWTPEEDQKLLAYIEEHGHGSWRALPAKAGLQRCGKSCRLRWTNYLRPDIKRGKFSLQEEQTIIQLHALLGNSDGESKNAANLSHMAQWESARLEAEARLVRESKLRSHSIQHQLSSTTPGYIPGSGSSPGSTSALVQPQRSLDVLKAWNGGWSKSSEGNGGGLNMGIGDVIESPTSTLTFSENAPPVMNSGAGGENSISMTEFVGTSGSTESGIIKEEAPWNPDSLRENCDDVHAGKNVMEEGFTHLLLGDSAERSLSDNGKDSDHSGGSGSGSGSGSNYYEDNKNYWNSILNLVNSSPSSSPMF